MPTNVSNLKTDISPEDLIASRVHLPLGLGNLVVPRDTRSPVKNNARVVSSKRKSLFPFASPLKDDEVHIGQEFLESASSFAARHIDNDGDTQTGLDHLARVVTDQLVIAAGSVASLYYDNISTEVNHDKKTGLDSHQVFLRRSRLASGVKKDVQRHVGDVYSYGVSEGKNRGAHAIGIILGKDPKDACVFKFGSAAQTSLQSREPTGRLVQVKVESKDQRQSKILTLLSLVRESWKIVEDQVGAMVTFQLRKVFSTNHGDSMNEETAEADHLSDLCDSVMDAMQLTFRIGKIDGYQSAQEKFKSSNGLSCNKWIYSFVSSKSEEAIRVTRYGKNLNKRNEQCANGHDEDNWQFGTAQFGAPIDMDSDEPYYVPGTKRQKYFKS